VNIYKLGKPVFIDKPIVGNLGEEIKLTEFKTDDPSLSVLAFWLIYANGGMK